MNVLDSLLQFAMTPVHWIHHRVMLPRRRMAAFQKEFDRFSRLLRESHDPGRFPMDWEGRLPCLEDSTATTAFDRPYVYHTAWAARILERLRPAEHIDISSQIYFVALVSAFLPVRFYDFRPPDLDLPNLACAKGDLMALPFESGSVESISCMHVVEHVGLGRYGDPMDPEGDRKAMAELKRVVKPGGSLLFVVPLAEKPRIAFNAHRIYSKEQIIAEFAGFDLAEFTLIPESPAKGGLLVNPPDALTRGETYACGCFWFRKKQG